MLFGAIEAEVRTEAGVGVAVLVDCESCLPAPPAAGLGRPVEKTLRPGGSANQASFSDRQGVPAK